MSTYAYDADGNQLTEETPPGALTTNTWDFESQNTQVELPAGEIFTYTYNSDQQRIAHEDDLGAVTSLVWDVENILVETDDVGNAQAEYTYEPQEQGNLVSRRDPGAGATAFYHFDALGSTDALSDAGEVVTDDYTYQAFGELAASSGTTAQPYQWVGEQGYYHDADIERHHLRRRQYQAALGRFLSKDPPGTEPGGEADDPNLYRYVANDPVNATDPSGLQAGQERDFRTELAETLGRLKDRFDSPDDYVKYLQGVAKGMWDSLKDYSEARPSGSDTSQGAQAPAETRSSRIASPTTLADARGSVICMNPNTHWRRRLVPARLFANKPTYRPCPKGPTLCTSSTAEAS